MIMAINRSKRIVWIVCVLLIGFSIGVSFDSDPTGEKRHEGVVARTETGIRNGFIGLGVGLVILIGVDLLRKR